MPRDETSDALPGAEPLGALAVALLGFPSRKSGPPVFVAQGERRADSLARLLQALSPALRLARFPGWDTVPYDRIPPSRAVMGQRAGVLRWLTDRDSLPDLVITTPMAVLQRVPPRAVWRTARATFRTGDRVDPETVRGQLVRLGYVFDERVDVPGEAALRGRVIDLFPAAAPLPCRIEHEDGRIRAIHSYDPLTQRTEAETAILVVDPASEFIADGDAEAPPDAAGRTLAHVHPTLETLFDYLPEARLVIDHGAEARAADFLEVVVEAHAGRGDGRREVPSGQLYLAAEEWERAVRQRLAARVPAADDAARVPRFVRERQAGRAFRDFIAARRAAGARLVFCAPAAADSRRLASLAARALDATVAAADDWAAVRAAPAGSLHRMVLPLETGFQLAEEKIVAVAAADLLGGTAAAAEAAAPRAAAPMPGEEAFRPGDAVVHLDHGLAILEGLEAVATGPDRHVDALMLRYADDARLKVPADEIDRIWRYGTASGPVPLDRLRGAAWPRRRARLEAEIRQTADRLLALARARRETAAPRLAASARDAERFAARFPYSLTPDQAAAVEAVLDDLASGQPMDRLVCGDVGFGKTEVALRAAAAAVLAGRQVAVVAPTTVLVRQHLRTFQRRFAPFGIEVAHLSRLVTPAEARRVKKGLADGTVRLVVGTHALAGKGVAFHDLGLLVIDEEQRFGAREKSRLPARAEGTHVLTLTATPIPRTLQAALIGLQALSLVATPPVRRQPVRTARAAFDDALVREALMREHRRAGQSFVVCPRIEEIAPMARRLAALVPELHVVVAHGRMPAAEMDEAMVRFADGEGDVLLATNIIESGLDVPRANTMLIWRADLFGLAQLHQLRGRVGRGARRGTAWLLTDPQRAPTPATEKRLRALEELDRLGAGFTLSARDLDLRGAGDLLGEEQAGHVKRLGLGLYQHLLARALAQARGEAVDDWSPTVHTAAAGRIPEDYVPGDELRIGLYARLAALDDADAVAAFEDEVRDRFGPLPQPVAHLFLNARLRTLCREADVLKLEVGAKAVAATPRRPPSAGTLARIAGERGAARWRDGRFLVPHDSADPVEQAGRAARFLEALIRAG